MRITKIVFGKLRLISGYEEGGLGEVTPGMLKLVGGFMSIVDLIESFMKPELFLLRLIAITTGDRRLWLVTGAASV